MPEGLFADSRGFSSFTAEKSSRSALGVHQTSAAARMDVSFHKRAPTASRFISKPIAIQSAHDETRRIYQHACDVTRYAAATSLTRARYKV